MGLLDAVPFVGPALDAVSGIVSANQARNAFKSRYQDTVKDMKKAGLNPALAYGQGGGNPQTSDLPNLGESVTRAATGAASAKQAQANRDLTMAQTDLLRAQTAELARRPFLENAKLIADTDQSRAHTGLFGEQTNLTRLQGVGQNIENSSAGIRNQILTIDRELRELDKQYAERSLEDRLAAVKAAAEQAGLNLTATEVRIALDRAGLVKAGTVAEGITSAKGLVETGAELSATTIDRLKDAVANFVTKQRVKNIRFTGKVKRKLGI